MKGTLHRDESVAAPADPRSRQASIPRTPEVILGPFYPADRVAPRTSDLTRVGDEASAAAGDAILISVGVIDEDGRRLEGVRVEFWQANAGGRYRHELDDGPAPLDPSFDGFGSQVTDARGRVSFKTVKPGRYRTALGETRAPHVHFQLTDGARRLVTQMFFPAEPLNVQDRWLASCRDPAMLIARASEPPGAGVAEFSWRIVLARRTLAPLSSNLLEGRQ